MKTVQLLPNVEIVDNLPDISNHPLVLEKVALAQAALDKYGLLWVEEEKKYRARKQKGKR